MKTFEEAYKEAIKENGCAAGETFARSIFKAGADNLIDQASANGQKKHQQGMDFMKSKAIEAFQKTCYFRSKGCICMTETGQCNCPSFFDFIKELD